MESKMLEQELLGQEKWLTKRCDTNVVKFTKTTNTVWNNHDRAAEQDELKYTKTTMLQPGALHYDNRNTALTVGLHNYRTPTLCVVADDVCVYCMHIHTVYICLYEYTM